MEEKIKIHITTKVYNTLLKDCEAFEFFKSDNISLNKNAFLNTLINNYYLLFNEKEQTLYNLIKDSLENVVSNKDLEYTTNELVSKLNKINNNQEKDKVSKIINLKPTKDSLAAFSYIEEYLLKNYTLSEFFRNLFSSYCSLPQDEREKIIFKKQYDTLLKAINNKKKVFFTTAQGGMSRHESSPYALSTSKEELHCYLLAKHKNICRTYRLSRIKEVVIINENISFEEADIKMFDKMIAFGPQFNYEIDEETVIIKLTNKGKLMFRTHYTHRPIPDYVEGDYYYFSCSYTQIYSYFRRFGKEAFVISPHSLQQKLFTFHKQAISHYQDNYKNNRH